MLVTSDQKNRCQEPQRKERSRERVEHRFTRQIVAAVIVAAIVEHQEMLLNIRPQDRHVLLRRLVLEYPDSSNTLREVAWILGRENANRQEHHAGYYCGKYQPSVMSSSEIETTAHQSVQ